MSKTIEAIQYQLKTKLRKLLDEKIQITVQIAELNKAIDKNQSSINNSPSNSLMIIPELEIAKMSFFIRTQNELNQLEQEIGLKNQELARLDTMEIRLNTELKLIERFQEKKSQSQIQKTQKLNQNQLDEWVTQRGVVHEN